MDDGPAPFEEILEFWFGRVDEKGQADADHTKRWWTKDTAFDALVRERFRDDHRAITSNERDGWLVSARGRLAAILVLDQFSRNMFRGTPEMFASDAQALAVALGGIDVGMALELSVDERSFFYMPLMHSEELTVQERSVELWTRFRDEVDAELRTKIANHQNYAIQHRDIVARFGRFPHRNSILGRASTDEEQRFLEGPGSSF